MRRRYVHRPGHPKASEFGMVAVDELDVSEAPVEQERSGNAFMVDRHYEGLRATDGTDIGSRRKHREYMSVHGLAPADDFTNTWKQATQKRAEWLQGNGPPSQETRELVGRIAYEKGRTR